MTRKEFENYKSGKLELPVFDSISLNKPMKVRNLWKHKGLVGIPEWKENVETYGYMFYLNGDPEKSTIEFTEDGFKFTNYHYDEIYSPVAKKTLKILRDVNTFIVKANNIGHFFFHDEVVGHSKLVK